MTRDTCTARRGWLLCELILSANARVHISPFNPPSIRMFLLFSFPFLFSHFLVVYFRESERDASIRTVRRGENEKWTGERECTEVGRRPTPSPRRRETVRDARLVIPHPFSPVAGPWVRASGLKGRVKMPARRLFSRIESIKEH